MKPYTTYYNPPKSFTDKSGDIIGKELTFLQNSNIYPLFNLMCGFQS